MDTAKFQHTPERIHDKEKFHAHYFMFPDNFLVVDQTSNVKGFLGRMPRPGYNEWQGERGTLVHKSNISTTAAASHFVEGEVIHEESGNWTSEAELRLCSENALGVHEAYRSTGFADHISPIVNEFVGQRWIRTYAETSNGKIEHVNPFRPIHNSVHSWEEYGACIMGHLVDFALAIRALGSRI